ncbi:MAG: HAMP domain-containing sensor histidine kinase [Puia sp.]|nr:HAMP domain-containing sensor histidine kinase [Puia sp.]
MKLNNKFTLWYLAVMLLVLLIGGAIVYYEIQWKIDRVEVVRHQGLNDLIADQIRQGGDYANHPTRKRATITLLAPDSIPASLESFYTHGPGWNPEFQRREYKLIVTSFYKIGGHIYRISSYSFIPSFYQLLPGVVDSFKWILLLLLIMVAISARLISKYILAPFKRTLKVIQSFDLKKRQPLRLPQTQTDEFRELSGFLQKMTDKALEDYQLLKEFTENAAHELQTPTAILRGKLELLMESDIRDEQAILIAEMQNSLEKLSRINSSLILLARLENQEYVAGQPIDFSEFLRETLAFFEELIQMKSLTLRTHIAEHVLLPINRSLADLLLTNLLSNAIRHNTLHGNIEVILSRSGLVISNTGNPPGGPTAELFQRFKKGNQSADSVGIGLAIVKQICDLHNFNIQYKYVYNQHILEILFQPEAHASKLLQNVDRTLHPEPLK